MSEILNFDDTNPAADSGYTLVKWKKNTTPDGVDSTTGYSYFDLSGELPNAGTAAVKTANYTATRGDMGMLLVFNSASAVTLTLPNPVPLNALASPTTETRWKIAFQNIGAGVLTIDRNGLLIDTAATNLTLNQNSGGEIYTDGTNYFAERGSAAVVLSGAANLVEATPDGSSGAASLRALVAADIPSLSESKITNLTTDLAAKVPATRTIATTAPLTGGGDLSADRTLAISAFTASGVGHAAGAVPDPGASAGATKFLREDATWVVPSGGGSSLYFGQGNATATAGNNIITLGSTPVTASAVSVFVAGSILPSSAYSISGAVVSLTSALSSGNVVVVTWVTTNSTPGGISLSTTGGLLGIAGWAMNEGSGLTLHDSIGGNDATISAGAAVTWQSNGGLPGTTPLWTGSGSAAATSATQTNFDGTTPFSVAVWVRWVPPSVEQAMVTTFDTSAGTLRGWELGYQTSLGTLAFFVVNNVSSNWLVAQGPSGGSLTSGNLYYIVVTYDGSRNTSGVKFYVNGSGSSATAIVNSLSATAANGLPVRFGARNNGNDELTMPMAFVEIFNLVLTPTQVSTFYAAGPQLN